MMIVYKSILILTIVFIPAILTHGSFIKRDRQGHERTWFQMSIPYLDTTIQFQPPSGFEPDRLFDNFMAPFQNWNPLEPPPFMRPFYDRPNQFRPVMPPPPPSLSPYSPQPTPETPVSPPNPNSISEPESESTFSVSSSRFNPSRRRWKPRWHPHPHHNRRNGDGAASGKETPISTSSGGNGSGCRYVPGTKGGRKCRPGHRFWEKSKPALPQPTWPFFVFPPPRPSVSDDKPEVPTTFTEVTKNLDPACGNRHLPRPTKPSELNPTTTKTTALAPSDKNETVKKPSTDNSLPKETGSSTTSQSPPTFPDSVDIVPNTDEERKSSSPSDGPSISSTPSSSSTSSSSSSGEPEKDGNSSEFESKNGSTGSEKEPGKEIEKNKEEKKEDKEIEPSSYSLTKDSDDAREKTNINNGEDISSSGRMTTMGPLEGSDEKENGNKKTEETKVDDVDKKIESKENENDGDDKAKKETVDLNYSPAFSSPSPSESSSFSSSENEVTTILNDNVNNEAVSTQSSTDLSNIDSLNEADILPDETDKGNSNNKMKSASPDVEAKRKRETEKEQFIKQIESMSIEDFRKLASKLSSLSS